MAKEDFYSSRCKQHKMWTNKIEFLNEMVIACFSPYFGLRDQLITFSLQGSEFLRIGLLFCLLVALKTKDSNIEYFPRKYIFQTYKKKVSPCRVRIDSKDLSAIS